MGYLVSTSYGAAKSFGNSVAEETLLIVMKNQEVFHKKLIHAIKRQQFYHLTRLICFLQNHLERKK